MAISEVERVYLLNESSSDKYYLIKLIRKNQIENKIGKMPMLILNGSPKFYFTKNKSEPLNIDKNDIKKIEIIDSSNCVKIYGKACIYGLINIKTFGEQEVLP